MDLKNSPIVAAFILIVAAIVAVIIIGLTILGVWISGKPTTGG